ncbi:MULTISPECIES: hypothetical protein [Nostoc]|uniref:Transposase n=1 Tax=Nostoc paludosum FACHB-159 TaxID=2692908 RepID=A0ABR8KCN2_9NOSO|nr:MULTISPECIES: hypothetical protein [Nostoc]MBD2679630.1 hypothetical protein [Nostoc sp. FACHB-857]MBD2736619.1 hypothetical protein [Nostoc paludosum FACHB-159]
MPFATSRRHFLQVGEAAQRSALETLSAVAHFGNQKDRAALPRRWLLKLLTGETQCRN